MTDNKDLILPASWNRVLRETVCTDCWRRTKPSSRTPKDTRAAEGYVCPACNARVAHATNTPYDDVVMWGRWGELDGLDQLTQATKDNSS